MDGGRPANRRSRRPILSSGLILAFGMTLLTAPAPSRGGAGLPDAVWSTANGRADSLYVWVYLTDKGVPTGYLGRALAEVRAEISPRALERRRLRGSIRDVVPADLPVASGYLRQLEGAGLRVRHMSRWLNAVSGVVAAADAPLIEGLSFVDRVTPLGRGPVREPIEVRPLPPQGADRPGRAPASDAVTPPDPAFYGASYAQAAQHQITELHAQGYTGSGVLIGVLDTGFSLTHRAFQGLTVAGQFDAINNDSTVANEAGDPVSQQNHGTYVWSALAANWPGHLVGPAYGATFLLAKTEVVASETMVEEDNWIAAIEWMESRGVDVTSTSLTYALWYGYQDMDGDTAPITIAADAAAARGVVLLNAAGNEGALPQPTSDTQLDFGYYVAAPADGDSVIAVGGVQSNGVRWSASSHGPTHDGRIKPDIMALSVSVASAIPAAGDTTLGGVSGTSLATPLAAGVAALLLEAHPEWTAMEVRDALRETGDRSFNVFAGNPDNDYGWGSVRAADALAYGQGPTPGVTGLGLHNWPNPFSDDTVFVCRLPGAGDGTIRIFTGGGALVRTLAVSAAYAATVSVPWDGRNADGWRVAPGVYFAVLDFAGSRARTTIIRSP